MIGSAVGLSAAAVTEFSHHARQHSEIDNADDRSHQRLIPVKPLEIRMQVAPAYSLREVPFATVKSVAKRRKRMQSYSRKEKRKRESIDPQRYKLHVPDLQGLGAIVPQNFK